MSQRAPSQTIDETRSLTIASLRRFAPSPRPPILSLHTHTGKIGDLQAQQDYTEQSLKAAKTQIGALEEALKQTNKRFDGKVEELRAADKATDTNLNNLAHNIQGFAEEHESPDVDVNAGAGAAASGAGGGGGGGSAGGGGGAAASGDSSVGADSDEAAADTADNGAAEADAARNKLSLGMAAKVSGKFKHKARDKNKSRYSILGSLDLPADTTPGYGRKTSVADMKPQATLAATIHEDDEMGEGGDDDGDVAAVVEEEEDLELPDDVVKVNSPRTAARARWRWHSAYMRVKMQNRMRQGQLSMLNVRAGKGQSLNVRVERLEETGVKTAKHVANNRFFVTQLEKRVDALPTKQEIVDTAVAICRAEYRAMFYTKEQVDVKVQECKQETRAAFAEMEQQLTDTEANLKAVIDENHNTSQRVRFAARTFVLSMLLVAPACVQSSWRRSERSLQYKLAPPAIPHAAFVQRVVPKLASLTRLAHSFPVYSLRTRFTHLLHSPASLPAPPSLLCTSPTTPARPSLRFAPPSARPPRPSLPFTAC